MRYGEKIMPNEKSITKAECEKIFTFNYGKLEWKNKTRYSMSLDDIEVFDINGAEYKKDHIQSAFHLDRFPVWPIR